MRIAIVTWSRRKVGGTETYLDSIIPKLIKAGHQVSFWHEVNEPIVREHIPLPEGSPSWCVAEIGESAALAGLRKWQPDVIYSHSLIDPSLEAKVIRIAPAVLFAHAYYGTCISGSKTFKTPVMTPCNRRFGWQCLMHYYPHRCGGLSPVSMVREYRRQAARLELLSAYTTILTHSAHMRDEYQKHGFEPEKVVNLSYYAHSGSEGVSLDGDRLAAEGLLVPPGEAVDKPEARPPAHWRLLFLGRMDVLKGGHLLIEALPRVAAALNRPVCVTFAGDGPKREDWQRRAERAKAGHPGLSIEFVGWVTGALRESLWDDCDLLVVPSVWPEPFGLVGPEAGLHSVPVVAYSVGGISEWLKDGFNGYLASGSPPSAVGLAEAIVKALCDPMTHRRMCLGAKTMAQKFNLENHLVGLLNVLNKAAQTT